MFDVTTSEFLKKLNSFYFTIDKYFKLYDTFAVHRETGYEMPLKDCDGVAYLDVVSMYIYQYCIENGLDITKISFD